MSTGITVLFVLVCLSVSDGDKITVDVKLTAESVSVSQCIHKYTVRTVSIERGVLLHSCCPTYRGDVYQ